MKYWVICNWIGVCAVSGSARKAVLSTLSQCISETPPQGCYWVANRLHIQKVSFFWKTVLLCYSEIYLLNAMVLQRFCESVWVILQLLSQALVYDEWNLAVTLVVSMHYSCFVLKVRRANWSMLCLVVLPLLKCSCTSADCISFPFVWSLKWV